MRSPSHPARSLISAVAAGLLGCSTPPAQTDAGQRPDMAPPDLLPDEPDMTRLPPVTGPDRLSDTGLYADFAGRTLAPGVFTYVPRYPLWSDGADKERFLLLPDGAKVDTSDMDNWSYPVGTRVWKHFRAGGKLVETRHLLKVRQGQGYKGWWRVAYVWRADGSDADAAPDGATAVLGTTHDVPSQMDCDRCHRAGSDELLGIGAVQLGAPDGQGALAQLAAQGRLSVAPGRSFPVPGSGATQDALGYLHANCGICHNDRSPLAMERTMRMEVHVADRTPADTDVYRTVLGAPLLHVTPPGQTVAVVPGSPEQSGLLWRTQQRDDGVWQMPPVCTKVPDDAGVATLKAWIASLP